MIICKMMILTADVWTILAMHPMTDGVQFYVACLRKLLGLYSTNWLKR